MLSATAEYGLRVVAWLAQSPTTLQSAERIAGAVQVPRRYLHKVLQDLVRAGLARSHPGPGGGYGLSRAPDEITILDVVNAVGSIERIRSCPLGLDAHEDLCPLHRELDRAYAAMESAFARVTMGGILKQSRKGLGLCEAVAAQAATHSKGKRKRRSKT
ncbi:MAG: Rrf2 family transcriptional regulator [Pirellulaceae bacterium]|jgi:Rrf2 family protein|nr:Rrf2 family transcriptional regulator [Pirellulaceae bacterium]